jgi:hypothetical protein
MKMGNHMKPRAIAGLKTATGRLAHEPMSMGFVRPVAAWMLDHRGANRVRYSWQIARISETRLLWSSAVGRGPW